jgi:hypothetical protein
MTGNCAATVQQLCSSFAGAVQQLCSNCAETVQQLCSSCAGTVQRLRSMHWQVHDEAARRLIRMLCNIKLAGSQHVQRFWPLPSC